MCDESFRLTCYGVFLKLQELQVEGLRLKNPKYLVQGKPDDQYYLGGASCYNYSIYIYTIPQNPILIIKAPNVEPCYKSPIDSRPQRTP